MFAILANRTYRHMFLAQIVALLGTGIATVALGLLAFDLAGADASMVLGIAFAIKMVVYVTVAPIAGAFAGFFPRRALLVTLNLVRAGAAVCLIWVSEAWHIYVLIAVLQTASAAFTPAYQATLPDILPDEGEYTRALSLSRLAYDTENIASPLLAALLLLVLGSNTLFLGTALGFVASALFVASVVLPSQKSEPEGTVSDRATRGLRIYLATPRLRGLLALTLAAAAVSAMVLVNSTVLVRDVLGLPANALAWTFFAYGAGSIVAALGLPALLERVSDRPVLVAGGLVCAGTLFVLPAAIAVFGLSWPLLLGIWALMGLGYSAVLTPAGRLLRASAHTADRPAIFAAQFALSHACWLVCYPLAGWLMVSAGPIAALIGLGAVAVLGVVAAQVVWPKSDPMAVEHSHEDLPLDHPHLDGHQRHSHRFVVDDIHPNWPSRP